MKNGMQMMIEQLFANAGIDPVKIQNDVERFAQGVRSEVAELKAIALENNAMLKSLHIQLQKNIDAVISDTRPVFDIYIESKPKSEEEQNDGSADHNK